MGSLLNVLFGAAVGTAIVLGFWQLASFADQLYELGREDARRTLSR